MADEEVARLDSFVERIRQVMNKNDNKYTLV